MKFAQTDMKHKDLYHGSRRFWNWQAGSNQPHKNKRS